MAPKNRLSEHSRTTLRMILTRSGDTLPRHCLHGRTAFTRNSPPATSVPAARSHMRALRRTVALRRSGWYGVEADVSRWAYSTSVRAAGSRTDPLRRLAEGAESFHLVGGARDDQLVVPFDAGLRSGVGEVLAVSLHPDDGDAVVGAG